MSAELEKFFIKDVAETLKKLQARDKALMRRISTLEEKLLPKKDKKSRYVKKLVVRKPSKAEIYERIDNRFLKKAAKKKAA
jgi:uncharacterized membrane-anchored protein YhcB (DUF1043 family)